MSENDRTVGIKCAVRLRIKDILIVFADDIFALRNPVKVVRVSVPSNAAGGPSGLSRMREGWTRRRGEHNGNHIEGLRDPANSVVDITIRRPPAADSDPEDVLDHFFRVVELQTGRASGLEICRVSRERKLWTSAKASSLVIEVMSGARRRSAGRPSLRRSK
jgi:hypothetical protein